MHLRWGVPVRWLRLEAEAAMAAAIRACLAPHPGATVAADGASEGKDAFRLGFGGFAADAAASSAG